MSTHHPLCIHEICQVANFYHNQVREPTPNQPVLVQNDTGPGVAAEAEASHSAIMNERNEQLRGAVCQASA